MVHIRLKIGNAQGGSRESVPVQHVQRGEIFRIGPVADLRGIPPERIRPVVSTLPCNTALSEQTALEHFTAAISRIEYYTVKLHRVEPKIAHSTHHYCTLSHAPAQPVRGHLHLRLRAITRTGTNADALYNTADCCSITQTKSEVHYASTLEGRHASTVGVHHASTLEVHHASTLEVHHAIAVLCVLASTLGVHHGSTLEVHHGSTLGVHHASTLEVHHGSTLGDHHAFSLGVHHAFSLGVHHASTLEVHCAINLEVHQASTVGVHYASTLDVHHATTFHFSCKPLLPNVSQTTTDAVTAQRRSIKLSQMHQWICRVNLLSKFPHEPNSAPYRNESPSHVKQLDTAQRPTSFKRGPSWRVSHLSVSEVASTHSALGEREASILAW
eukprot:jgi/Botrbrau1/3873/Bobra.0183s0097.1